MTPSILTTEIVLVGGGHCHALVLRALAMDPIEGARVTVVNPGPTAPYTGMLPGHVAGHYDREALDIDLIRLARAAGARILMDRAVAIDREARRIDLAGGRSLVYDIASINVGITSEPNGIAGFGEHGIAAKPLGDFARAWSECRKDVPIGIIGGGVGGCELALAMAHARSRGDGITILDQSTVLQDVNHRARATLLAELKSWGISVLQRVDVKEVTAEELLLSDGRSVPAVFTVGAAGARIPGWLDSTGLDGGVDGLCVGPTLQTSDPSIFAVGDCAYMTHAPRPKAGVFAVRQAPILLDNMRAVVDGKKLRHFNPQRSYLKLVSLGGKSALAIKWGRAVKGPALWRWKDWIDRRFMDRLNTPHGMDADMLCSGCGAKVAPEALKSALSGLPDHARSDVISPPGDDAALLEVGSARQVITTDHLSAVTEDPPTMARIAAVHALGDVWSMGAQPQAALASITLPRMTPDMQRYWLAEIMEAAAKVFAEAGARIAGGHSSMGSALTIGFTVTGLVDGAPILLSGAQPGDPLILTKPIGTGVILAGEMRGRARGPDVLAALESMARPSGDAAQALRGAHAMTDITGFGLGGHLMNICTASNVAARLTLDAIPLLPGANELAVAGVRSTLWPDNAAISDRMRLTTDPRCDLLFDPQTAGGLLAAVAPDQLANTLQRLGSNAWHIGELAEGPPQITVL